MKTLKVNGVEYVEKSQVKTVNVKFQPSIPPNCHPWKVGNYYLVRTVTMIVIGKLQAVGNQELVFTEAGWCADTSRFHQALKTGTISEMEPAASPDDPVIVGRGAIVDCWPWNFPMIQIVQK